MTRLTFRDGEVELEVNVRKNGFIEFRLNGTIVYVMDKFQAEHLKVNIGV